MSKTTTPAGRVAMTTPQRLWLGFGVLLSLLMINGFIIAACLKLLRAEVEENTVRVPPAANEMRSLLTASENAVVAYLDNGDSTYARRAEASFEIFAQLQAEVPNQTPNAQVIELAAQVDSLFHEFRLLGQDLMAARDAQYQLFLELGEALELVHDIVERGTPKNQDPGSMSPGKVRALAGLESAVAELGWCIWNFDRTSDLRYRELLFTNIADFEQKLTRLPRLGPNEVESHWLDQLDREFKRTQSLIEAAFTLDDRQKANRDRFTDLYANLDGAFDEEIQTLTSDQLAAGQRSTQRFGDTVTVLTLLFLGIGLATGIGTAVAVGRAIWRSERLLRVTLSNIGDAIVTGDTQGRVTSLNPVATALTGWTQEEALGEPIATVVDIVKNEGSSQPPAPLTKGGDLDIPDPTVTSTLRSKDGTERPVESRVARIQDRANNLFGTVMMLRDVTERRLVEAARKRREDETTIMAEIGVAFAQSDTLEAMLQRCVEATLRYHPATHVQIWTLSAERKLLELEASAGPHPHLDGPHRRVPLGESNIGLIAQARRPCLTNNFQSDFSFNDKEWARREDVVAFVGYPLITENQFVIGVMALFSSTRFPREVLDLLGAVAPLIADGISQKLMHQEREQMLVSEQAARNEAERIARSKDEFLASISHELRTPLQAIVGWTSVMRSSIVDDPKAAAEAAEIIERNAHVQAKLIDDLLDVSRIIAGKTRLDIRRVELMPLIKSVLEMVRPLAQEKGVEMDAEFDQGGGTVMGDPTRLQQAISNVLTNAIKFTPSQGHVHVTLEQIDSQIEISVTDTGQGIPPEFLPHVFDEFRQGDPTTTRRHGGLGLGLAIVKHLVRLHGGTVRAESSGSGQGATFRISLPLAGEAAEDASRSTPMQPEPAWVAPNELHSRQSPDTLDGIRILLVEDSPDTREAIKRVLEGHRAEVLTAETAREALQVFNQCRPHVLISDIGLPEQDGYQLIRSIRELTPERGGETPAVALTALARSRDRQRAFLAGFQVHISKPVEPEHLVEVVARLARNLPSA